MDQAQLQLVISAQNDRVLAGLNSFEKALNSIEKAHVSAGQQAEHHAASLNTFGSQLERVARFANLFVAFEAIKTGLAAFDGLEQHNIDLLKTTEILGGNATAASTWSVAAHELNINLDLIDKGFTKLSTDMNSTGNPALRQMGIAAEDSAGKLRPLNDVINDAANYFHAHAGAANNTALANALFGKSGYELLPILQQGTSGLAAITEEARKYGLILDASTIQRNAAFTFQMKEAGLAADGLGMALGNAALPGLAALGQAFSKVIEDNLPAFIGAMNRAVSYVIGFAEALTGMDFTVDQGALSLSNLTSMTGDTGSAMDSTAGASQRLQDAIQGIRDRTKDATDAIDAQIRSLNNQQQAQAFMDKQAQLQDQLGDKNKEVLRLQRQQYTDFWLGNFQTAANAGDQITAAQEEAANLQLQIVRGTEGEQTKSRIAALEAQKKSIGDVANEQIAAMQAAARGSTAAMTGAAGSIPPLFSQAGKNAAANLKFALDSSAEGIGKSMGSKLVDAIFGPETQTIVTSGKGGNIEKVITGRSGGGDWIKIGEAIGAAIGQGITTAIGKALSDWLKSQLLQSDAGRARLINDVFGSLGRAPRAFASGGMVPGPLGSPQLAVVHGGEEVRTPEQQKQGNLDTSTLEQLLRQLIALVAAGGSSQPSSGTDAMLSELMERVSRSRARGMVGAAAR